MPTGTSTTPWCFAISKRRESSSSSCADSCSRGRIIVSARSSTLTSCRFRRALFYPDTIEVGGRASEIADDRFTMEYRVVSLEHDEIVAEGSGVIVSFDYGERKKVAIPDDVRAKLKELAPA